jgi:signal-transduction protein with cAMP-binding, CBS, and nucleotidyltransferase domain
MSQQQQRDYRSSGGGGSRRNSLYKTNNNPNNTTVSSLRPAQAITVLESARISQAAQLMAAKRGDAVLAVNEEGQLSGILTDKDIAYRVVAEGLDIRNTTVAQVMTRNPISVHDRGLLSIFVLLVPFLTFSIIL